MNLSSGYYTIKYKLLKEYNIQVRVDTLCVHVNLPNHIKNKFINLFFYFNHFNYIIGYYIHQILMIYVIQTPLLDIIIVIIIEQ